MLATRYAEYYGIEAQQENESDVAFRHRVAGILRDRGMLIEAHEAQQDEFVGDSQAVVDSVTGAIVQALQGVDYGVSGERQIGFDIVVGALAAERGG